VVKELKFHSSVSILRGYFGNVW